jgi:hypothetical protein
MELNRLRQEGDQIRNLSEISVDLQPGRGSATNIRFFTGKFVYIEALIIAYQ